MSRALILNRKNTLLHFDDFCSVIWSEWKNPKWIIVNKRFRIWKKQCVETTRICCWTKLFQGASMCNYWKVAWNTMITFATYKAVSMQWWDTQAWRYIPKQHFHFLPKLTFCLFFISQRCILLGFRPVSNKWHWAFFHELVWKYIILQQVEYKDHELPPHNFFKNASMCIVQFRITNSCWKL